MSSLVGVLNLLVVIGAALSSAVAGLAKLPPRVVFAVLSFVIKPLFSVVTEFPFLELFRSMRGVFWSCVNPLFQLGILSCSTLQCSFLDWFCSFHVLIVCRLACRFKFCLCWSPFRGFIPNGGILPLCIISLLPALGGCCCLLPCWCCWVEHLRWEPRNYLVYFLSG